jgi:hypothetical protein
VLLGIVALRLYLGSSWGMSRRGRRDVEEGIVRDDIPGSEFGISGLLGWGS